MTRRREFPVSVLLLCGVVAFVVSGLSIADMFLPRPYDGIVLETDIRGRLLVREVVPDSGAEAAGIRPGDEIIGIDRNVLQTPADAAEVLNDNSIGDEVPYLVRGVGGPREVLVELGRRQIGSTNYIYIAVLGFSFFFVGVFVLAKQPGLPTARVFFLMSTLFLLFLVCRLRPASYSWVDSFVLTTGTLGLLFLPATFLHFFLIFPSPVWEARADFGARLAGWLSGRRALVPLLYLIPSVVYAGAVILARTAAVPLTLISGAPEPNWWVMAAYMILGLGALAKTVVSMREAEERRGALLVLLGTIFGVVPFLLLAVATPALLRTERYIFAGVVPLILVPVTFAFAIVRFQVMRIRIILRRSVLYTITTALVTALYAAGIVGFYTAFAGTKLAGSPLFPIGFALAIVVLFEPLRHRLQEPVDRFFFAERSRLQSAVMELGQAFRSDVDFEAVVKGLVNRLPELLRLKFAALYLIRGDRLERLAGPSHLPEKLARHKTLFDHLRRRGSLTRLDQLSPLRALSTGVDRQLGQLAGAGVEAVGLLSSSRQTLGLVLLSGKAGQTVLEADELELLQNLLNQAALGLETALLLQERTRRAELERELSIAASIQDSLLPRTVSLGEGWRVAAVCRPARQVGGDFYAELPGRNGRERALVWGDVSGKSVPGALMMMAAHEVLNTLALVHPKPEELLTLANRRLYALARRQFVALGYLAASDSGKVRYSLAGQPPVLLRSGAGEVSELPLPRHRVPLGALKIGGYELLDLEVSEGDALVAYSDGVVEAKNADGEEYGWSRLLDAVASAPAEPAELVAYLSESVGAFAGEGPAYDDITIIAVMRNTQGSR